MAELGDFNAEDHKPMDNLDPIPPGKYQAMVIESDVKPTKSGDGKYVRLVWQVTEGTYAGRKVFDNVNLENPNQQAVEIGLRQLSSICRAVHKLRIRDSAELHNLPCMIDVRIRAAQGDYGPQNEIKGYSAVAASPTAAPTIAPSPAPAAVGAGAPASAAAPAKAAAGGKPPWARK